MTEAEMDQHLGCSKSERSDSDDYRNGYKPKKVNSSYGSMEIQVPQDCKSTIEPQVVKKCQKDISDIDQKIISMYAKVILGINLDGQKEVLTIQVGENESSKYWLAVCLKRSEKQRGKGYPDYLRRWA